MRKCPGGVQPFLEGVHGGIHSQVKHCDVVALELLVEFGMTGRGEQIINILMGCLEILADGCTPFNGYRSVGNNALVNQPVMGGVQGVDFPAILLPVL